ncbi:MAG: ABC transporter ATP-binding protein [Dehalococcoidia bacterium]|nr:ABC transporter ATP-binding protein [Dehalococcoidia bacterium]
MTAPGSLRVREAELGYGSSFRLPAISFEVAPGEVVGVIGPNGSGKSTLLRGIARVLPLLGGQVTLGDEDIGRFASRIAYVPQREDVNWEFPATALDVVLMGRYRSVGWFRRPGRTHRELALHALERLGLGEMGGRHISQFSGGQQQRIFLARALVQEPLVLLLDEPFTGVDAMNRALLHELIAELAGTGVIVLMATHDLDEVTACCSHVCCLNHRLVAFGPTATTYTPATIRETFGGQVAVFS